MRELYEDLEEMCDVLADELAKTNEKLEKSGGTVSAGDIEYIDKLTHAIKSIKTTKAMLESEEGHSYDYMGPRSYRMTGSYARGRGSNAKRDSRGRYSSERGYSRDEGMIMELHELMEDAPDEKTRAEFKRFISKLESM